MTGPFCSSITEKSGGDGATVTLTVGTTVVVAVAVTVVVTMVVTVMWRRRRRPGYKGRL